MENLIVIGHPDKKSFCYNGIMKTIIETLKKNNQTYELIDLYADKFSPSRYYRNEKIVKKYQDLVAKSKKIYIISPVWWFRCPPLIAGLFDQVFAEGFAYVFVPITKIYAYPKPLLGDKKVRTYLTHGAPSIPVLTLYLNSVKLRLVMGVYSFVFGWFKTKTRQFWSVPFVDLNKRIKYLRRVEKDVLSDIKK